MSDNMKNIEKRVYNRFNKALKDYGLIEDGDKILVGLSGGKDSLCLLEIMAERKKIFKPKFEVEAVHIRMSNIDYETDISYIEEFCSNLEIRLHVMTADFDLSTDKRKSPCFLCSWNRRKQMFRLAQEIGFNKIALGHHLDDVMHTAMMNIFFQGRFDSMPAKLKMEKMPITIIRPLCLEYEADIVQYADYRNYKKQKKRCPYESDSNRNDVKELFARIEHINPEARFSMLNALAREGKMIRD